jgi:hypothetical protein
MSPFDVNHRDFIKIAAGGTSLFDGGLYRRSADQAVPLEVLH